MKGSKTGLEALSVNLVSLLFYDACMRKSAGAIGCSNYRYSVLGTYL